MIGGSNKMISLAELGEFLAVPMSTIYKQWRTFGIPHVVVAGRPKFRERDVALYLERLEREAEAETAARA